MLVSSQQSPQFWTQNMNLSTPLPPPRTNHCLYSSKARARPQRQRTIRHTTALPTAWTALDQQGAATATAGITTLHQLTCW